MLHQHPVLAARVSGLGLRLRVGLGFRVEFGVQDSGLLV